MEEMEVTQQERTDALCLDLLSDKPLFWADSDFWAIFSKKGLDSREVTE